MAAVQGRAAVALTTSCWQGARPPPSRGPPARPRRADQRRWARPAPWPAQSRRRHESTKCVHGQEVPNPCDAPPSSPPLPPPAPYPWPCRRRHRLRLRRRRPRDSHLRHRARAGLRGRALSDRRGLSDPTEVGERRATAKSTWPSTTATRSTCTSSRTYRSSRGRRRRDQRRLTNAGKAAMLWTGPGTLVLNELRPVRRWIIARSSRTTESRQMSAFRSDACPTRAGLLLARFDVVVAHRRSTVR